MRGMYASVASCTSREGGGEMHSGIIALGSDVSPRMTIFLEGKDISRNTYPKQGAV